MLKSLKAQKVLIVATIAILGFIFLLGIVYSYEFVGRKLGEIVFPIKIDLNYYPKN